MPAGWVTVNVSVETSPTAMVVGTKALVSTGVAGLTTRFAVFETKPVAACVLETPVDVVFGLVPAFELVTSTETTQLPFIGMVNPVKFSAVWLLVSGLEPPQPTTVCAPETDILTSVSENPALVSAMPLLLVRVKLLVEVPPTTIGETLNALTTVGASAVTASDTEELPAPIVVCAVVTPLAVFG